MKLKQSSKLLPDQRGEALFQGVTIIIVSYNGSSRLHETLRHLAVQKVPDHINWEVILVNNASTDNTVYIARTTWQDFGSPAPLVILEESRPGTDHARRTGIFAARYNYFLFCDDDNWLSPEYIALGFSFLDKRPKVGLVGGRGTAVADIPLPIWFEDVSGYYAATSPAKATQDMTHWGIWGAGMMGRTNLVRAVLPNHLPLLVAGRVGTDAGLGEDGEICMRVALAGYQVWYYDELVFEHCIIPQRLSLSYKAKLISKAEKAAEVIGTYTRAVRISSLSSLEKVLLFVRHFSKWMCPTNANKKFTADYCYYLTGMKIWETPLNTQIRMLAKHITKIKNTTSFE